MKVNEVDVVQIPSLPELMALPAGGGDVPIYNGADNILYRIKAALLGGGSETAVKWNASTTYAIDVVVEFGLKLWLSQAAGNTGNTPIDGMWWVEVSKSTANGFGYWAPGVFTVDPSMVLRSGGLFYIDNQVVTFPFNSVDFEAEYAQNKWVQVAGSDGGGAHDVEDLGVTIPTVTKKVLKVDATGNGVDYTDYDYDQVLNTDAIDVTDPTWMESEERLLLVKKVSGAPAFEGAAALVDIFAPPGVEPTLRDNTGWTNDVKTITGDNSTYALGQKGQVIWLNDHVYCQCTSATYAVAGSATYTRNRNIDVLDPATSTQDASMANALDPSYTYPAMTVTGNSTDLGWDLTTQTKVVTSLPVKLGSWFVGGVSGAGYEYHCFAVSGTTSYWKRRGTPDSYQRPIYSATHPTLTAHLLAHDFNTSAYTQITGDEATYADQTFYDATTRAYFIKMINGNWEKLR